jgi:hypothetical protein
MQVYQSLWPGVQNRPSGHSIEGMLAAIDSPPFPQVPMYTSKGLHTALLRVRWCVPRLGSGKPKCLVVWLRVTVVDGLPR